MILSSRSELPHVLLVSFLLILLSKSYLVRSKIAKLPLIWFFSVSFYVFILRLKYLHRHSILENPQSTSFPLYKRSSFIHVRNTKHIRILCLLFLIFIGLQREDKDFGPIDNNIFPNLTCFFTFNPGVKRQKRYVDYPPHIAPRLKKE